MLNVVAISAGDQNVTARAGGEIFTKTESRIIRVIEQEEPLFMLSSKPIKSVLPRGPYSFGERDVSEIRLYGFRRAGINEIDV